MEISIKEAKDAARQFGKDIHIVEASSADEIDRAFATLVRLKADALEIAPEGLFIFRAAQVAELAARHAIPASHERRAFPVAGGLMSYGASQADGMRLAGIFAGRVLKGEKPADMPVLQPTKFELVLNLNAAKILGFIVPATLLVTADEVINSGGVCCGICGFLARSCRSGMSAAWSLSGLTGQAANMAEIEDDDPNQAVLNRLDHNRGGGASTAALAQRRAAAHALLAHRNRDTTEIEVGLETDLDRTHVENDALFVLQACGAAPPITATPAPTTE